MKKYDEELELAVDIVKQASNIILEIYSRDDFECRVKSDDSPLTEADLRASDYICKRLEEYNEDIPIICEETEKIPYEERKHWKKFWLVDPLDGTKEFIKRNGEFTVNIALIDNDIPVVGVVSIPCQNVLYYGSLNAGSYKLDLITLEKIKLECEEFTKDSLINVVASRSHINKETEEFISKYNVKDMISVGSSIKFMMICENRAHIYPRLGPTCEWDIGASEAILREANGKILTINGENIKYNKISFLNPYFIAYGNQK